MTNGVLTNVAQLPRSLPLPVPQSGNAPNTQPVAGARDAQLDPKLVTAAHEFEASMMAELLKPLNSGGGFGDDSDGGVASGAGGLGDLASSADGSGGALMSFSSEALARALSEKGGLGIARRILDHFEAANPAKGPASRLGPPEK